jgi:protoporphyrinogen oxidase
VSPQLRSVTLKDGRRFRYDTLISTMPLPALIAAIGDEAPPDVQRAASELRHVSIRCVNLGVARPRVTDKHWIHFPDGTIFHRVFVQGNASPHCNPAGGFGLICEISYSQAKPLPVTGTALIERCMRDCIAVGLLDASDSLLTSNEVDIFHAYVIHDRDRAGRVTMIRDWLARFDIALAGRFGEWEHVSSDHAFVAGRKAAEAALRRGAVHAAPKRA